MNQHKQVRVIWLSMYTKILNRDTIFSSPTGDGTTILRGYPSYSKVQSLGVQYMGVTSFLIYFKTLSNGTVRPRESNLRP